MPRQKSLVNRHTSSRRAEQYADAIRDSTRFGRAEYLVKTDRPVALLLIDLMLQEYDRIPDGELDQKVISESIWWKVYHPLRGECLDLQYTLPKTPLNRSEHLRVIETLELAFALVREIGAREGTEKWKEVCHV